MLSYLLLPLLLYMFIHIHLYIYIYLYYLYMYKVRTLMRFDPAPIAKYDLSSLRVLGSVGRNKDYMLYTCICTVYCVWCIILYYIMHILPVTLIRICHVVCICYTQYTGEPINPEAWRWFHTHVGRGQCRYESVFYSHMLLLL